MNIVEMLPLQKKSLHEYAGPCPFCGGKDRFIVWPEQGNGGRFFCRQCQKNGDMIDYLRSTGMSYRESKKALGDLSASPIKALTIPTRKGTKDFQKWITNAKAFTASLSGKHQKALTAILSKKHLKLETAQKWGIVWNGTYQFQPSENWGFPSDQVRVPVGLVVPIWRQSGITGLKIRVSDSPNNSMRYCCIKESSNDCLILGCKNRPTFIVESELDAYLMNQESGELITVIALGGTHQKLDPDSIEVITSAPKLFIATDYDETPADKGVMGAGQKAFLRLKKQFPKAIYYPPIRGKDPCEMQDKGISVRDWVECALEELTEEKSELKLPADIPNRTIQLLKDYPYLICCPKTIRKWFWVCRTSCKSCAGHLECIKNIPIS
jgi:hypothetical protein